MNIIEPTQNERDNAIKNILAKGLKKPRSVWHMFREIRQLLGFRFVFWDTAQALTLSAITLAGMSLFILLSPEAFKYTVLFGCSPLLFVIVMLFSETIERMDGLYGLKLTCKYTILQITTFRILCFSLLGIVFCGGVTVYQAKSVYELLRLFPLSLCALFFCSFISLFFIRRFAGKLTYAFAALLWMLVASVPALLFGNKWELLLSRLPVVATIGIAILFVMLFLYEAKKLMNTKHKEVAIYAVG